MGGDSVGTSSHEWVDKIVVTREAEVEKWSVVRRECRLQHKKQVQAGSSQPFRNHIWVVSKPFAAHVGPCCNASMACGGVHRERGARFVCWTYEACKELWGLWWAMGPMRRYGAHEEILIPAKSEDAMCTPLSWVATIQQLQESDIICPSDITLLRKRHVGEHQKNTSQLQNTLQAFIISNFNCWILLRKDPFLPKPLAQPWQLSWQLHRVSLGCFFISNKQDTCGALGVTRLMQQGFEFEKITTSCIID